MNDEETYRVTIHLINGKKFKVYGPQLAGSVDTLYKCLGAEGSRVKFPTGPDTMQFLPASSVLRVEVVGSFD